VTYGSEDHRCGAWTASPEPGGVLLITAGQPHSYLNNYSLLFRTPMKMHRLGLPSKLQAFAVSGALRQARLEVTGFPTLCLVFHGRCDLGAGIGCQGRTFCRTPRLSLDVFVGAGLASLRIGEPRTPRGCKIPACDVAPRPQRSQY
jgi:hypothetical protein